MLIQQQEIPGYLISLNNNNLRIKVKIKESLVELFL